MLPVETPFKTYTGLDGKPLDNGYVYFGQPDQDPIAHPVTVYWDAAGTLPAAQPLRTVNGYIMNSGTPANVFYEGAYSELVQDSKARQVFYSRTSDEFSIATAVSNFIATLEGAEGPAEIGFTADLLDAKKRTLLDKARDRISIKDYVVGDGVADDTAGLTKFFSKKGNLIWDAGVVCAIASQIVVPHSDFQLTAEAGAKIVATAPMQSMLLAKDKSRVFIYGLDFDCANKTQIGMYFRADVDNPDGLDVFGCTLSNSSADPTLQYGLVCVDAVGGAGGAYKPRNIRVNGNYLRNAGTHGCLIAYADRVEFHNNWVDTVANHGMEAVQSTNVTILGNKVRNCTVSGLGVGTNVKNFLIADNLIDNCGGDASITIEHNDAHGSVHDNIVTNCRTTGLNFSFGTPTASPFDKIQRVTIHDNYFQAAPGITVYAGMNIYSSTGGAEGVAIHAHNNTFVGFNGGMTAAYLKHCIFKDNIVTDLTGTNTFVAKLTYVTNSEVSGWKCDTDTSDHAFQLLDYAGQSCDRCTISGNTILASGGASGANKAMVYIEGNGGHTVSGNRTGGSKHYLLCTGNAAVLLNGNDGNLSSTPYSGGIVTATNNGNSTQDFALVAGRRITMGTSAPTTGTWVRGDRCLNIDSAVGAPTGWDCTVAGSPGTWVAQSNL